LIRPCLRRCAWPPPAASYPRLSHAPRDKTTDENCGLSTHTVHSTGISVSLGGAGFSRDPPFGQSPAAVTTALSSIGHALACHGEYRSPSFSGPAKACPTKSRQGNRTGRIPSKRLRIDSLACRFPQVVTGEPAAEFIWSACRGFHVVRESGLKPAARLKRDLQKYRAGPLPVPFK
jgi:hypothetical protein